MKDTPRQKDDIEHRRWIDSLLVSAQKRNWYGSITIELKRGKIDLVRTEETMKPPSSS